MKIEYNPFAKGFRENGQSSKSKAKRKKSDDLEEQPQVKRSPVADPHQEISSSSDNGPSSPSSSSSSVEVNRYSPAQRFNYAPIVSYVPYCPPYNFGWYQPPMGWYRAVVPQQTERSENVPNERQVQEAPRRLTDFSVDTILGLR